MKRGKAQLNTIITNKGLNLTLISKPRIIHTRLQYPRKIWQQYNQKEKLTSNLAYLLTLPFPLVANFKELKYNTNKPELFKKFQQLMLKDLPSSTFEYKKQDPKQLKKQFLSTKISFSKQKIKKQKTEQIKQQTKENSTEKNDSLLLLSFGKDSLLSLGILNELNLSPVALYINDTVSPTENQLKIKILNNLIKEKILTKAHIVMNSIEKLNDFDTWNAQEMAYNYAQMVTSFFFIALPLTQYYNTKYILSGNEKNMDFFLIQKNERLYPVYDQSTEWTKEQDKMLKIFQKNLVAFSIIKPITDIAILKILHIRYPKIAKYQSSCYGLDASNRKRWCHDCFACTGTSLFLSAFGINPKVVRLPKFFKRKHKKLYSLFDPSKMDVYDTICSKEQELLAFLMALRNGQRGYVIDKFKKYYLKEALAREDELRKKYFSIYSSRIPQKIKPKVLSIYKEELKDLI
jgi:hypothetical protein